MLFLCVEMAAFDPFPDYVRGYPKLAAKFEILPEVAIYRRFGALNALNLLYYQAELTSLEEKLYKQQKIDDADPNGCSYARNWNFLHQSRTEGNCRQLDIFLELRQLLKPYSKTKLLHLW